MLAGATEFERKSILWACNAYKGLHAERVSLRQKQRKMLFEARDCGTMAEQNATKAECFRREMDLLISITLKRLRASQEVQLPQQAPPDGASTSTILPSLRCESSDKGSEITLSQTYSTLLTDNRADNYAMVSSIQDARDGATDTVHQL
jgi:hypothetical protein